MENNTIQRFQKAEILFFESKREQAKEIYAALTDAPMQEVAALSYMRLGEIANQNGKPVAARRLLLKAFQTFTALASLITPEDHPYHHYVYPGHVKEKSVKACPLCGKKGTPYWSYIMVTNLDYQTCFNPVRTWMYCGQCHHLYASASLPPPSTQLPESNRREYIKTAPALFMLYSDVLNQLKIFTRGDRLLEVGIGGGELISVAQEMGYDAVGLDISCSLVKQAREMFQINAQCMDFMDYHPDNKFHIICMGDVIEHMPDPQAAIHMAAELLEPEGILWISTPNFEGAHSKYLGHNDPMKRVAEHLNYFSFVSLEKALKKEEFELLNYRVSRHYNGSMEIIARKP